MREKEEKRKSVQVNIEVTKYRRDNVYKQNPLHSDGIRGDNSRYLSIFSGGSVRPENRRQNCRRTTSRIKRYSICRNILSSSYFVSRGDCAATPEGLFVRWAGSRRLSCTYRVRSRIEHHTHHLRHIFRMGSTT